MNLYVADMLADLHRAERLEEAANERLLRSARAERTDEDGNRAQVLRLVAVAMMVVAAILVLTVVTGFTFDDAVQIAGKRSPGG